MNKQALGTRQEALGKKSLIKNHRDLEVWQLARELVKNVYLLTEHFPQNELYTLSAQMKRAAISVPSNIAEGHSRRGIKDYIQFVSTAIGSLAELETQIILAEDLNFSSSAQTQSLLDSIMILQRKLHALRNALKAKT